MHAHYSIVSEGDSITPHALVNHVHCQQYYSTCSFIGIIITSYPLLFSELLHIHT